MNKTVAKIIWVLIATFSFLGSAQTQRKTLPCAKVDLLLLFDFSGSMTSEMQVGIMTQALQTFTQTYNVDEKTLGLGVIVFSGEAKLVQPITFDVSELNKFKDGFSPHESTGTRIWPALEEAKKEFLRHVQEYPSRQNSQKVILLFSDGDEYEVVEKDGYIVDETKDTYAKTLKIADELKFGDWNKSHRNVENKTIIHALAIPESYTVKKLEPTGKIKRIVPPRTFTRPAGGETFSTKPDTIMEVRIIKEEKISFDNIANQHLEDIVEDSGKVVITNYKQLVKEIENLNICE